MNIEKRAGALGLAALFVIIFVMGSTAGADKVNPAAAGPSSLPADLFVREAPQNAVGVGLARKEAQAGKPIVLKGRIGGVAQPIANKYAIFLIADLSLALCNDGCADFCHIGKEVLMSNMATVQVVDKEGKPLKVSIEGVNGMKPLVPVVVRGTVVTKDDRVLIVNAHNIYVEGKSQ